MSNKYTLTLTPKFKRLYTAQYKWSLETHGLKQTEHFFETIDTAIQNLRHNPKLYRARANTNYRLLPLKSALLILYTVDDQKNQIKIADLIRTDKSPQKSDS